MEQVINLEQLRTIRDGSGHSVFGPSGSSMWLNCPGSLVPNLLAPDNAGVDAAYGTVGHEVTETWLKAGVQPKHLIGRLRFIESGNWGHVIKIDAEMLEYARQCVDWVEWLPGVHMVERRVDFSRITPIPNQSGTADFITIHGDTMWVVDWKFGRGIRVYAERNTQGMLYALGALWKYDPEGKVKKIIIRIGQPRLDHFDEWEVSRDDLLEFAGWAKARMAMAWSLNAPRVAGSKQCQFCRVAADCAAASKLMVEMTEGVFDNLDTEVTPEEMASFKARLDREDFNINPVEVGSLTTEQLVKLKPFRKVADKWWHHVEDALLCRALDGTDLTPFGQKIVEGRAFRIFVNEEKAETHLASLGVPREKLYESKFVSPSKAEELLKKAGFRAKELPALLDGYTRKPPGKPTIVPLSDKRQALVDLSEVAFDDLDVETEDEEM